MSRFRADGVKRLCGGSDPERISKLGLHSVLADNYLHYYRTPYLLSATCPDNKYHSIPAAHSPLLLSTCNTRTKTIISDSVTSPTKRYQQITPPSQHRAQTSSRPLSHTFAQTDKSETMAEHNYKFDVTMSCGGCSGAVTRVLTKLDGRPSSSFPPSHSPPPSPLPLLILLNPLKSLY